jgi:hypothetical protein
MKVGLRFNKRIHLRIEYGKGEYDIIERKLIAIGLEKSITNSLFGQNGLTAEYYRNSNIESLRFALSNSLSEISNDNGISFRDDINNPILYRSLYNLAMFRMIPDSKGIIEIPVEKFLTVAELKKFSDILKSILELILNIPDASDEVEISIGGESNG